MYSLLAFWMGGAGVVSGATPEPTRRTRYYFIRNAQGTLTIRTRTAAA